MNQVKKPIYKKWWFWLIVLVVIGGIGSQLGGDNPKDKDVVSSDVAKTEDKANDKGAKKETKSEPTFGDVIEFDGLEITFSNDYQFTTLQNQFSDRNGSDVIKVPVHIKNVSEKTNGLNMFYVKNYGTKGVQLDDVYTYFSEEDMRMVAGTESLRSGAEVDSFAHILYDGDGDYFVSFDNFGTKVEVKLPISK